MTSSTTKFFVLAVAIVLNFLLIRDVAASKYKNDKNLKTLKDQLFPEYLKQYIAYASTASEAERVKKWNAIVAGIKTEISNLCNDFFVGCVKLHENGTPLTVIPLYWHDEKMRGNNPEYNRENGLFSNWLFKPPSPYALAQLQTNITKIRVLARGHTPEQIFGEVPYENAISVDFFEGPLFVEKAKNEIQPAKGKGNFALFIATGSVHVKLDP